MGESHLCLHFARRAETPKIRFLGCSASGFGPRSKMLKNSKGNSLSLNIFVFELFCLMNFMTAGSHFGLNSVHHLYAALVAHLMGQTTLNYIQVKSFVK